MTNEMVRPALFLAVGMALGAASLATLRTNTALYLGGRGVAAPAVLHLARLAVVGGVLVAAARLGADTLLAAAAGLVLVRPIAMRVLAGRAP